MFQSPISCIQLLTAVIGPPQSWPLFLSSLHLLLTCTRREREREREKERERRREGERERALMRFQGDIVAMISCGQKGFLKIFILVRHSCFRMQGLGFPRQHKQLAGASDRTRLTRPIIPELRENQERSLLLKAH